MLEFEEYKSRLNALKPTLVNLGTALHLREDQQELDALEAETAVDGFWNNVEESQRVQKRISQLTAKRDGYR